MLRKKIVKAFMDVGKMKGFDNVTVKDIAVTSEISRNTFYYYFKDIPDLIDFLLKKEMEIISKESMNIKDYIDAKVYVIKKVYEKVPDLKELLHSKWRNYVESSMYEAERSHIKYMLENRGGKKRLTYEEREFIIDFISYGGIGFIINNKFDQERIEHFAKQLQLLVHSRLEATIE